MKKININKGLLASAILAAGFLSSASVSAANIYNMDYEGGSPLDASNVSINPTLINSLTPLIADEDGSNLTFSNSSKWEDEGYVSWADGRCDKIRYIRAWDSERITEDDDISYSITGSKYASSIKISGITVEDLADLSESGDGLSVGVNQSNGWLFVGFSIYAEKNEDGTCNTSTKVENVKNLTVSDGGKVFVETNIKLNKKGATTPFVSDELYFGITDIDQAQSYKILNPSNLLTKNNMFAESASSLQPADGTSESEFKNMFVVDGNYIYAKYDASKNPAISNANSNIYVKINAAVQEDGLDMVYGYVRPAGSGLNYYAKQYVVNYKSDENGTITGIKNENVIAGLNPTGSTEKPNEGYTLQYWIADVDVTLKDGTVIKAGTKITDDQIKNVAVNSDITFTAINDNGIIAPDTGYFTGEHDNVSLIFGIALPVGVTLTLITAGIISRKKHSVGFNK